MYEFAAPQTSQLRHLTRKSTIENMKNYDLDNGILMDVPTTENSLQLNSTSEVSRSLKLKTTGCALTKLEERLLDETIESIIKGKNKAHNKNVRSRKPATEKQCEYCGKDLKYPSKIEV